MTNGKQPSQPVLLHALDNAITAVAGREYSRLIDGLSANEVASRVNNAMDSLGKLTQGEKPAYDEWDALFYLTWYQPRQVHLVYTLLKSWQQGFSANSQVIDVGCGAWAVQVAVALYMADCPSSAGSASVSVHGIDPSGPMRAIGEALWLELWDRAEQCADLERLSRSMSEMSGLCRTCDSVSDYAPQPVAVTPNAAWNAYWITSVHAVYKTTTGRLKQSIEKLCTDLDPEGIMLSSDDSKQQLLHEVLGKRHRHSSKREITPVWKDKLRYTTSWRQNLLRLPTLDSDSLTDKSRNFLRQPVRWNHQRNSIQEDSIYVWKKP